MRQICPAATEWAKSIASNGSDYPEEVELCYSRLGMNRYFLSTKTFFAASLVLALALAVGCGSSGDASSSGSTISVEVGALSKAEFVKQANEICKESDSKFKREFTALLSQASSTAANADPASQEEVTRKTQASIIEAAFAPDYEQIVHHVSALGAPEGGVKQVSAFLRAIQEAIDKAKEDPAATFEQLTPFKRAIKLATAYGMTGCAESLY